MLQRAGVERQDHDLVRSVLAAEAQVGRWSDDLELSTNRILMEKKRSHIFPLVRDFLALRL